VTAEPPRPSFSLSAHNGRASPSTAEMQHAIQASLTSPPSLSHTIASKIRSTKTASTYLTYGLTQALFNICSAQANYTIPESQRQGVLTGQGPPKTAGGEDLGVPEPVSTTPKIIQSWWLSESGLGLNPTFSTWSQVSFLHMYLLSVRLRGLSTQSAYTNHQRYLLEHFSHAAEEKMLLLHNITARSIRNKYLKDLFLQWRGVLAAYDEGMVQGDALLAGAVWRNLWKGAEGVDWTKVAEVVAWMRRVVRLLANVEVKDGDGSELFRAIEGRGVFERARKGLRERVEAKSQGIEEGFKESATK